MSLKRNFRPLVTKLFIPLPPRHAVKRLRLLETLERALEHPLTLVSAPAGYSKTSSVAAWLEKADARSAWLSLDKGDNDVGRFWQYVTAALSETPTDVRSRFTAHFEGQRFVQDDFLIDLVNALVDTADASERDLVLVLDDYHLIEEAEIHNGVAFLLTHLAPRFHLIIISRSEPPLPLARLRAQQRLLELSVNDLRFTLGEVKAFLNEATCLELTNTDIETLEAYTEGWAVGVQLASLSLQSGMDAAGFAGTLARTNRFVFDYLADEVLSRQPQNVQTFLLQTSLLERFSAELCASVMDMADVYALLKEVEQANLFLVPLDPGGAWYRYHHLFAEFLRRRLEARAPERVPELYIRAARWCEAQGLTDEAIRYVLAGGDIEGAVALVERHDRTLLWRRDERTTLRPWLEVLPEDVIRARVRLSLDHAWLLLSSSETALLERRISDAERLLGARSGVSETEGREMQEMQGELAVIRAERATERGAFGLALDALGEALALLKDPLLRGVALQSKGYLLRTEGNLPGAERALLEAEQVCSAAGNIALSSFALSDLGEVYKMRGQLHQAASTFERALVLSQREGRTAASPNVSVSGALIGLADVLREQNRLGEAFERVHEGFRLAESARYSNVRVYSALVLAQLQYAQGGPDNAQATLVEVTSSTSSGTSYRHLNAHRALLHLRGGDVTSAARVLGGDAKARPPRGLKGLVYARLHFVRGNSEEALRLLTQLLSHAEATGRKGRALAVLVLEALIYEADNKTGEATEALKRALDLAQPESFMRVFLDEGEPLRTLLQKVVLAGDAPSYAATVLQAFPLDKTRSATAESSLLTAREHDVLRLIAEGHSNQAIAEKLIRSVGTVKSHTSSIYSKLGVKSRTEAVARAKEIGLLR